MGNFKFTFVDAPELTLNNIKFIIALNYVFSNVSFKDKECIKVTVVKTGEVFYYHKNVIAAFLQDDIDFEEFSDKLKCDDVYRAKVNIRADNGTVYYAQTLWARKENLMILVDDDEYITTDFKEDLFTVVE